ncbi:hypothetical protein ACP70R_045637 [Stipagrostis hirtigluma subsp. patula]
MDRGSREPVVHLHIVGYFDGIVTAAESDRIFEEYNREQRSRIPPPASSSSSRGTRRGVETISRPVAALYGSSCGALHLHRRPGYATGGTGTRVRQSAMYSDRPRRSRGNRGQAQPPTDLSLRRRPGYATDGTGTRVRQSAMYSDRPRRSRGNRGQAQPPTDLSAEEAGVETSNEHADMAKFETLSLNDSPPTLDSPDGAVVHYGDTGSGLADSTIMVPSAAEEALSPRSEYQRLIEGHPVFDTIEDAFEYLWDNQIGAQALAEAFSQQSSDEFEAQSVVQEEQARSVPAPEQELPIPAPEPVQAHGQYCEASNEEIAQNGKKWMSEEVMVAFRKYVEKHDDLKELEYKFGELHRQCFSVENYHKIFHHFNFTVKMKAPGSTDWTSMLCFAEVKEILTQKIYFCSPLEPYENGHCDACKNQGMDELKHPVVGTFDRGSAGAEFPPKTEECNYLMYEVDPFDYVVPALRKDEADEYDDRWIGKFRWGPAQLM